MVKGSNSVRNKKLHSSKPYDASNSFVKKFTSRVTNILPQSTWLSKWFTSSVDSEGHNKEALNSNDSGSEDEDTNAVLPPPPKRAKIPLNQQFPPNSFKVSPIVNDQGSSQQSSSSRIIRDGFAGDGAIAGPSGINTRQLVSSTPNIPPTASHLLAGPERKMNGDDRSESSESTSGCSSLVPQGNRQFQARQAALNSLSARQRSIDEKLNFTGHLQSPRSLFSDRSHSRSPRLNSSINRRRPSFNVSSFGSPVLEKDRSSAKNRIINSPFYSGRTTYGGASAYRTKDGFFVPNESMAQKRCGVQVKPVKCAESDSVSSMSSTARRILEALEQFSTPVLDAKRIPMEPSTPALGSKRKRPHETAVSPAGLRLGHSPLTPNSARPQTSGLTIPTVPDLLKMRHREKLQDSLEAARLIAASTASTPVSSYQSKSTREYRLRFDDAEKTGRHGGKMKGKEKDLEEETVEELNLPNISLPITTLPKFDFVVPPAASTPSVVSTFKFATPITVTENARTCSSVDNFTFSKPLSAVGRKDTTITNNKINCVIPPEIQFISLRDRKLNSLGLGDSKSVLRKKSDNNSETCLGVQPATELKTGSVMDILGKMAESTDKGDSKEVSSSSSILLDKFKPAPGTWECGTCMIRNKSDATKCAACKTPRTSPGSVSSSTTPAQVSSGVQFKMSLDTWECTSCHVRNLSSAAACTKCATRRQNSSQATEAAQPPEKPKAQPSGFGNKFKPASDTWECGTCLVRNPESSKQCQACETKRPGLVPKTVSPPKPSVNFGFGDKFKKPAGTWECSVCMIPNKNDVIKCAACETAKPGTESQSNTKFVCPMPANAGAFKFGIDKAGDIAKESTNKVQGFTFGVTAVTTASQFSFGINSTPTTTNTATGASSTTTAGNFSFGSPVFTTATSSVAAKPADTSSLPQGGFSFGVPQPSKFPSPSSEDKRKSEVPKRRRSSDSGDSVTEAKGSKLNLPEGTSELFRPVTTVESKKSEEKSDKKKVSFSFDLANKPSATTKTVDSIKPAFSFGVANSATANFSSVQPTATTASFNFTPSNTMAAVTTTVTTTVSAPVTTVSAPTTAASASLTTTTTASNLFSFGSSKPSVSFGGSPGVGFGQPTTTSSSTPSFGTGLKTPAASTFSFSHSKPFGGSNKEAVTTTASKETATPSFGSMTGAASITAFGPVTTTITTTTTAASNSTAPSLPSFGTATTIPSFSLGASRSTVPAFGTMPVSAPTTSETTTATTGFGMVSTPNFGTGFSAVNEQKSALPTTTPAATFAFGTTNNSSAPSLGQTTPFSFGGIQNDQGLSAKGAFTFGAPSNNNALGTVPAAVNSGFGFGSNNPTSNQVAPAFSFGSNAVTTSNPAVPSLFGSSATPAGVTLFGAGATGAPSLFGTSNSSPAVPTTTAAATTTAAPTFNTQNFSFGSSNTQPSTNVFGFAGNQASVSQSFAAPTSNFTFGQASTSAQSPAQLAPPTFNPNVRPSFNFTKGETPSFTASGAAASPAPGPARRIKKAVRRTHPR